VFWITLDHIMRYASLKSNSTDGPGTVVLVDGTGRRFWPIKELLTDLPSQAGENMVAFIASDTASRIQTVPKKGGYPLDLLRLLAPITTPPHNIMCVGKNYRAHAHEFSRSGYDAGASAEDAIPQHPVIFTKPSTSIAGPNDDIPLLPGLDAAVDYEAELAVVIGRTGRFITRAAAMRHIFGYTVMNDVTARDLQREHRQWFLGKGIDGFGPMGPWIVTADELDVSALRLSCRVNGEIRQDASTADLIFDVPTLIETLSKSVTLAAGDVIATGTPAGVGIGFEPPRFLQEGDVVECEIEGIGKIKNTLRRVNLEDTHQRRQL
jgi:2-keto-4-pentenoate hydratase/2-oxohepta-3-ene-1,7-dioic acid hydratase in catechol pathway